MLTDAERSFLCAHRVARLATCDAGAQPHVIPVCYGIGSETAYFSIDRKPKRAAAGELKRLRNIRENPRVALVVDRYDDDWQRLGWVMLQGPARVVTGGDEHAGAQRDLCRRYAQLGAMDIGSLPVVIIRIRKVLSWGNLDLDPR
jgi:PPOX class probable F420-dependent enzyme